MSAGWTRGAVGLGGNLGDVAAAFAGALGRLDADPDGRITAVSSLWRTEPWGLLDQPDFLNAVALLETRLDADALLTRLQEEEAAAGRERTARWGPRRLDLDLLWFGEEARADSRLSLPHPLIERRSFVIAPALEVAPDWVHPLTGDTLYRMRERLVASDGWTRCEIAEPPAVPACRD
ncbi:2-amino-4-hydroxy-6-hydroxymethyldihydropteridine diphosphokinase [bacterium]|nr:2-amino-4-hydroxy-6-hydroxymethyldihydropteridine diphosphokinase [bacterium]